MDGGREAVVKPGSALPSYYIQHRVPFSSGGSGVSGSSSGPQGTHPAIRQHAESANRQQADLAMRQHGDMSIRQQVDPTMRHHGEPGMRHHGDPGMRHHVEPGMRQHGDSGMRQHGDPGIRHSDSASQHGEPIRQHHDQSSGFLFHHPSQMSGSPMGFSFQVEPPSLPAPPRSGGSKGAGPFGEEEGTKKKRGRPRKYKQDGSVTLGLSPSPSTPAPLITTGLATAIVTLASTGSGSTSALAPVSGSGSALSSEKRGRGRPPGTGKIQQLASLGELVVGSVGTGFTPHVILVQQEEDIAAKIMAFSQQGPRAVFILSAYGAVSTVALHPSTSSGSLVTYEGRFEILCLSGSYLTIEDGNSRERTGGLSICICGPDGRVIGGTVGGTLKASGMVQVIVGSFVYGNKQKGKSKVKVEVEAGNGSEPNGSNVLETTPTTSTPPDQNANLSSSPMSGSWPGMRHFDMRPSHIDINSSREHPHSLDRDQ